MIKAGTTKHELNLGYDPFGMLLQGRIFPATGGEECRFGFNGKETDNETRYQDYGYRMYDPLTARFISVDPLTKDYPWYTPYQFAGNKPIWCYDIDGLEDGIATVLMVNEWERQDDLYSEGKINYEELENMRFTQGKAISMGAGLGLGIVLTGGAVIETVGVMGASSTALGSTTSLFSTKAMIISFGSGAIANAAVQAANISINAKNNNKDIKEALSKEFKINDVLFSGALSSMTAGMYNMGAANAVNLAKVMLSGSGSSAAYQLASNGSINATTTLLDGLPFDVGSGKIMNETLLSGYAKEVSSPLGKKISVGIEQTVKTTTEFINDSYNTTTVSGAGTLLNSLSSNSSSMATEIDL